MGGDSIAVARLRSEVDALKRRIAVLELAATPPAPPAEPEPEPIPEPTPEEPEPEPLPEPTPEPEPEAPHADA